MPVPMVVEFASGNKVIFGRSTAVTGLSEVSLVGNVAKATADGFKSALGTLGDLVAMMEDKIGRMPHRPKKVEMEFRASISGECVDRVGRWRGRIQGDFDLGQGGIAPAVISAPATMVRRLARGGRARTAA
jgi:hypothetical protein